MDFCIHIFIFYSDLELHLFLWSVVSVEEVKNFKMQFGDIDERLGKMCFVCLRSAGSLSDLDYRLVLHI